MRSQKPAQISPHALLSARAVRDLLGVSAMTAHRWRNDPKIAFPAHACVINGRRFFRRSDIEAFITRLIATNAGGRTTAAPDPRRRAAKSRARMGGAVP